MKPYKIYFLLCLFLLFSAPVFAEESMKDHNLKREEVGEKQLLYIECIIAAADIYSHNAESADVLADGALGKCFSERASYVRAMTSPVFFTREEAESYAKNTDVKLRKTAVSRILDNRTQKAE